MYLIETSKWYYLCTWFSKIQWTIISDDGTNWSPYYSADIIYELMCVSSGESWSGKKYYDAEATPWEPFGSEEIWEPACNAHRSRVWQGVWHNTATWKHERWWIEAGKREQADEDPDISDLGAVRPGWTDDDDVAAGRSCRVCGDGSELVQRFLALHSSSHDHRLRKLRSVNLL